MRIRIRAPLASARAMRTPRCGLVRIAVCRLSGHEVVAHISLTRSQEQAKETLDVPKFGWLRLRTPGPANKSICADILNHAQVVLSSSTQI